MYTEFKLRTSFTGIEIVESVHATELVQDWSECRSPSRSKRRHRQGIRTRLKEYRKPACYMMGDVMVAHPEFIKEMRKKLAENHTRAMERRMLSVINGGAQ